MTETVNLKHPITVSGKTYTQLTFRRPKAKDMAASDFVGGGPRGTFAIYASIADVEIGVIEELDYADYVLAQRAAEKMVGNSLTEAGEGPLPE